MAIPSEYLNDNFDFGFSAVDEDAIPVQQPTSVTVDTEEISQPIVERIASLEANVTNLGINVGEILNILERLEQASTPTLDTDEYKLLITKDVKEKLQSVERLILPLLVNLMKNPEKEVIKWPNRAPIIEKQIEKILAITRS
jgi:hypothetical protein